MKNSKALPDNAKVRYQFFYTVDLQPRVTVCYIDTPEKTAVGLALCSFSETSSRKRGRSIAYGRALAAWRENKAGRTIHRDEAREVLESCDMNSNVKFHLRVKSLVVTRTNELRPFRYRREKPWAPAKGVDLRN